MVKQSGSCRSQTSRLLGAMAPLCLLHFSRPVPQHAATPASNASSMRLPDSGKL